ncbi:D-sedoheptulose 7-phosphate isomerase [Bacteroidota bacterium]
MEDYKNLIKSELVEARDLLNKIINTPAMMMNIEKAARLFSDSIKNGNKVLTCGNGGSHCDAMHFAEELTGKFRNERKPIAAIAISDPTHITCVANDFGVDQIFSRYVEGVGNAGDILLAISTSGNSENILKAVQAARMKNMFVVALTGKNGGNLAPMSDIALIVPHDGYSDRIQEIHIKIIHILIYLIEKMTV